MTDILTLIIKLAIFFYHKVIFRVHRRYSRILRLLDISYTAYVNILQLVSNDA